MLQGGTVLIDILGDCKWQLRCYQFQTEEFVCVCVCIYAVLGSMQWQHQGVAICSGWHLGEARQGVGVAVCCAAVVG